LKRAREQAIFRTRELRVGDGEVEGSGLVVDWYLHTLSSWTEGGTRKREFCIGGVLCTEVVVVRY
jgi:hypothetical protein